MKSLEDILSFILEHLKREISDSVVQTWFDDIKIQRIKDDVVYFLSPIPFKKDVIEQRYCPFINKALNELFGQDFHIVVELEQTLEPEEGDEKTPPEKRYTFDNFIIGESNKFAAAAAMAVADSPGKIYNPLLIYGGSGLGKTHLLQAVKNSINEKFSDLSVISCSAETFSNDLVSSIQHKTTHEFHKRYRENNCILIDDIQFISGKEFIQEEFFYTFNAMYDAGNQIVLISDRPPREMIHLEDRLRTRFEWGLLVDIQQPDLETRIAIVRSKAKRSGLHLPDQIIEYLAQNVTQNVRHLEASVQSLVARRDLINASVIDVTEVQNAILDFISKNPGFNPTPEIIIDEVIAYFQLEKEDLLSKKRDAKLVYARQLSMYLIRLLTNKSFKYIGSEFFKKDHTTVLHACDKIEEMRKDDNNVVNMQIKNICDNIKSR